MREGADDVVERVVEDAEAVIRSTVSGFETRFKHK